MLPFFAFDVVIVLAQLLVQPLVLRLGRVPLIVRGDIKPSNIRVSDAGVVKLLTDPQRDMAGILRLTGGTVVLGVASSELEWSMVDAGPRFANMVSAIRGWVLP